MELNASQSLLSMPLENSLAPLTLDGDGGAPDVKPKQAVIVGLARATAEGPRATREQPRGHHDYQAFAETPLSRADADSDTDQSLPGAQDFSGTFRPPPDVTHDVEPALSATSPPTSLPPGELKLAAFDPQAEHETQQIGAEDIFESAQSQPDAATRLVDTRDSGVSDFEEQEPTRAIDLERLAESAADDQTRLVPSDSESSKRGPAPKSLHDVDWDLD